MASWNEIKYRYFGGLDAPEGFYGCVDPDGFWFDSALTFEVAVHWCCMAQGQHSLTIAQELEWMTEEGVKLGYSIVHSRLLEKLANGGILT